MAEKLIHNGTRIDYIVTSGSSFRKLYSNGVGYTIKSYTGHAMTYAAMKTMSTFTYSISQYNLEISTDYSKTWNRRTSSKTYYYGSYTVTAQTGQYSYNTRVVIAGVYVSSTTSKIQYSTANGATTYSVITNKSTTNYFASTSSSAHNDFNCTGISTVLVSSKTSQSASFKYFSSNEYVTSGIMIPSGYNQSFSIKSTSRVSSRYVGIPWWNFKTSTAFTSTNSSVPSLYSLTNKSYTYSFNETFYGENYNDVAESYNYQTSNYIIHWTRYGSTENRIANTNAFFVFMEDYNSFTY